MLNETRSFHFEKVIKVPPELAFQAFNNSTHLREWLCDIATVDPRCGGRIYLAWNSGFYTAGEFVEIEPSKKLSFTWLGKGEPARTHVGVEFSTQDGNTLVSITHSGLGSSEEWERVIAEGQKGWSSSLENLASVLETGEDLRFTQRPMLGIGVSDFNEEIAGHLGVPVAKGIRIEKAIEGMGAADAGLQANDVLVSLGDYELTEYISVPTSLQKHRAGDAVKVVFYRGAELKEVTMVLSARPIPPIPATIDELSRAVRVRYNQIDQDYQDFLAGVIESEASFKPGPNEWNIKEIIAHMIHSERAYHDHITEVVEGQERHYDSYSGNLQARIDATLDVFPTLDDLCNELIKANRETVALFSHLPLSVLEHKGSYWRIAYEALEPPYHHQSHLEQMTLALQAAREGKS